MRKIVIGLLILNACISLALRGELTKSVVFLALSERGKILIYNNEKKQKVIKKMGNDFVNEDYLMITIFDSRDSLYFVEASYAIANKSVKGWITKNSNLSVFLKMTNKKAKLYKEHSKTSASIPIDYTPKELKVLDYYKGWLKVKIMINDKAVLGWLPREGQCGNPYTTCN